MVADKPRVLEAAHPDGTLFAAVDGAARYVTGRPATSKLGAILAPFSTVEAARDALRAAGGEIGEVRP